VRCNGLLASQILERCSLAMEQGLRHASVRNNPSKSTSPISGQLRYPSTVRTADPSLILAEPSALHTSPNASVLPRSALSRTERYGTSFALTFAGFGSKSISRPPSHFSWNPSPKVNGRTRDGPEALKKEGSLKRESPRGDSTMP
jgi:hypothetical protein